MTKKVYARNTESIQNGNSFPQFLSNIRGITKGAKAGKIFLGSDIN